MSTSVKRSIDFKIEVVKDYLRCKPANITLFCNKHGIERRSLYRWLEQYRPYVFFDSDKCLSSNSNTSTPLAQDDIITLTVQDYRNLITIKNKYETIKMLIQ